MKHSRLVIVAWAAWACFVLSHYYVQLLRAVAAAHVPSPRIALAAAVPLILVVGGTAIAQRLLSPRAVEGNLHRTASLSWLLRFAAPMLACASVVAVPWLFLWPRLDAALSRLGAPGLPWLGEAIARIAIGLVGAGLVAAATMSAGLLIVRLLRVRFDSRTEQLLFAAASGVAAISYGSLGLALAGIYRPITVALLVAAALAAGVPSARAAGRQRKTAAIPLHVIRRSVPWLALVAVALGYAFIAAVAPEKEYDALWYHLYLPRVWLDAGRPVDLLEEFVSLYPLTWELMFGAGMTLGGVVAAKLLHFVCLPLLGCVVWRTARRFFPEIPAAAAVAFVVITPTVLWESTTAYVDLALALHSAAGCLALARYAEVKERGWGGLAALQFGLAAATKHLGVIVLAIALIVFVLRAARSWGGMQPVWRAAAAIGLAAMILPGPWYLRSWLASGNPVFPEMFAVFGAAPPERWDADTERGLARFKAHFGMGRSIGDLAALPWNVTVHGARFGGSMGPLFLVLLPGLLWAPHFRRREAWLAAGVAGYVAVWASPISSYQLRFLVPIVPPLALLAASSLHALAERANHAVRLGSAALTTAVLLLGVLNMPPFTAFHEADREGWNGWLTHVLREPPVRVALGRESASAYLTREVPSFAAWQWINAHLPSEARVLTTAGGDQLYSHRRRIPYDGALAGPAVWVHVDELGDAAVALRRLGLTHVLFDWRELSRVSADPPVLVSPAFLRACEFEYADGRFRLCRIEYSRLPSRSSRTERTEETEVTAQDQRGGAGTRSYSVGFNQSIGVSLYRFGSVSAR